MFSASTVSVACMLIAVPRTAESNLPSKAEIDCFLGSLRLPSLTSFELQDRRKFVENM